MIEKTFIAVLTMLLLHGCACVQLSEQESDTLPIYIQRLQESEFDMLQLELNPAMFPDEEYGYHFRGSELYYGLYTSMSAQLKKIINEKSQSARLPGKGTYVDCGAYAIIRFYNGEEESCTHICVTPIGFSFGGDSPRTDLLFYNPQLADWLVERFERLGLRQAASTVKNNRNLYTSYQKNRQQAPSKAGN